MIALCIKLLCFVFLSKEIASSYPWKLLNPPIAFGEDVALFCNASDTDNCCSNTAAWMKEKDLIADHTALSDSSKYGQKQCNDGFLLIIKNFDEDDINQQYTCLYGFSSCTAVLRINRKNFKYWPIKEKPTANFTLSDKLLFADIVLETMYPSPMCFLVVNENMVPTNVNISEETRSRHFYKTSLHLVTWKHHMKCINSIAIHCTIGGLAIIVDRNNNSYCPDSTTISFANEITEKTTNVSIIFAFIVTTGVAVVISVMIWRKKKNDDISRTVDDEERSCSGLCWGQLTIPIVTPETIPLIQTHTGTGGVANLTRSDDGNDEDCERIPLLGYNSVARTSRIRATISAQKDKAVTTIVNHEIGQDSIYIQMLITNYKINIAFLRKDVLRLKAFRYVSNMPIKEGQSMTVRLYGPAQKEKDVTNMVNYAKLFDKNYAEKLASDERINRARVQKTIPRLKSRSFLNLPAPVCTNESDVNDVFTGSSLIPTWGVRKRTRIRK